MSCSNSRGFRFGLLRRISLLVLLGLVGVSGLSGCRFFKKSGKEAKGTLASDANYQPADKPIVPPTDSNIPDGPHLPNLKKIYFDFDQSGIRQDQLEILDRDLKNLNEHPEMKVLIMGHSDERGSTEYNFALGERRAKAVMDYLLKGGISPDRLKVLSKGEESPADPGHSEEAWAKNRRCEFLQVN
ncbi:OmpA family protein [Candidatus Sumerlaeota bacterium]|nr:OmpA family protein [Candidatus Sumerlaeota bacterium]